MRGFLALVLLASACSGSAAKPAAPKLTVPQDPPVDQRMIVLATSEDLPYGVAVDDYNVYFTLVDTGIMRTPKLGGPIDVVTADDHGPHPIVVDDLYLYAADLGTPDTDFRDGRVIRILKTGGAMDVLASGLNAPNGLVLQGDDVVFSANGTRSFGAYNNDGEIWRVPRDGSAPATRLAKDQRHPMAITADATYAYWVNDYAGTVVRCALAGCNFTPEVLYDNQNVPQSIAVDGMSLYWANRQESNVVRASKNGGGDIVELAASVGYPESLLLDHGVLFWVDALSHKVQSIPRSGATRPTVVFQEDMGLPTRVAVDATSVYFTDQGNSNVVRIPR
jgi:hypothetical protein